MSIGESYAQQMLAVRGQRGHDDDENLPQLESIGRGIQTIAPQGAVEVAIRRDEVRILQKLKVLASAAGSRFYYRFPVKNRKEGTTTNIEGASIDCALAVARTWGNCDVDVRVEDKGDSWVFLARFRDFETGFTLTRAYQQRKGQVAMNTKDPGRALDMVFQIGQSKAIRNVICNALGDVTEFAFEEAKSGFVERVGQKVEFYRGKAVERLADLKIDVKRVEAVIGKASAGWLAPDLARIIAELQSIQDGMSSPDDLYPVLEKGDAVSVEEPKRQVAAAKTTEQPVETKAEQQAATSGGDDGGGFDFDDYLTQAETRAAEIADLSELSEFDQHVTETLTTEGADDEVTKYWRGVVTKAHQRIAAAGQGAKGEPADPDGFNWEIYATEVEKDFAKAKVLTQLNADWQEVSDRLHADKAPAEIRIRLEKAKAEREAAIKTSRSRGG